MLSPIGFLPPRYRTFARYFVSGGIATLIHYATLSAMVELGGIDEVLSTATGYALGAVGHYLLSYHWAFGSTARHRRAVVRFIFVAASTLLLNAAVFWVFHEMVGLWYLLAQLVTTVLLLFVNFTINARFTFAER